MSIYRKVAAVEKVFGRLQKEIDGFQSQSTLKCLSGCGKCCTKPDIEATVLEFLPMAYYFYKQGTALETLEKLESPDHSSICHVFRLLAPAAGSGYCGEYQYRGLICRLFGFSATRDKNGQKRLATCQLIKADQADQYHTTVLSIQNGSLIVPMMSDYHSQLAAIDHELGTRFYPINEAIRRALEVVLFYYQYREGRKAG